MTDTEKGGGAATQREARDIGLRDRRFAEIYPKLYKDRDAA